MNGAATGGVRLLLRIEGLCVFAAVVLMYARYGPGWSMFALFFLAPDLSLLGYLAGTRIGAACYNGAHSHVGALACAVAGMAFGSSGLIAAALIWAAHIGSDRALGYGLKYDAGFFRTHLGRIGREPAASQALSPPA